MQGEEGGREKPLFFLKTLEARVAKVINKITPKVTKRKAGLSPRQLGESPRQRGETRRARRGPQHPFGKKGQLLFEDDD
jgi:hypothetical protein